MNLTLGFSPCPNDTYMFAALVNGWIDTRGYTFTVFMEDVETLNEWAVRSRLDVTKMSFHRALALEGVYSLLSSGSALGHGCGPLVIARTPMSPLEVNAGRIALPGQWTTAHLLFKLFFPEAQQKDFMLFHRIEQAVVSGEADAGVIIHENRFTYQDKGLVKVLDLGEEWEKTTGMPIPLGGIFRSNRLPAPIHSDLEALIRDSILFARAHPETVMPYVRSYAQEMTDDVIQAHISLYVNDYSLDLGPEGLGAVDFLKKNQAQVRV